MKRLPLETQFIADLRRARQSPGELTVPGNLERYLEHCAHEAQAATELPLCGNFDGSLGVVIRRQPPDTFLIHGAANWGFSSSLVVFELELHLDPDIEEYIPRCIFRLGEIGEHGGIKLHPPGGIHIDQRARQIEELVRNRPQRNADWAVAVSIMHKPDDRPPNPHY